MDVRYGHQSDDQYVAGSLDVYKRQADALLPIACRAKKILVAESALGQVKRMITDGIYGCTTPIETLYKPGEGIYTEEIEAKVLAMAKGE